MRLLVCCSLIALAATGPGIRAQSPVSPKPPATLTPETDLDAFMARALQRRDVDRKTLGDYVLDEVETFQVLAPGRVPVAQSKREYTWFVQDGIHVRSPVKVDGVPIPEADRRKYEADWIKSEQTRQTKRTERAAKAESSGQSASAVPPVAEPRFVSESYFMDFKFEPGNYYLAGHEALDKHDVLKIDYLPTNIFDDEDDTGDGKKPQKPRSAKETQTENEITRKMNKTSQVTLWVDPTNHQIVKYTFDNIWMDFLPAGWLVKLDDIRASMEMEQPFDGVWLPRSINIHAGVTVAIGSMEISYNREFSNYRKAEVTSRIRIPKDPTP